MHRTPLLPLLAVLVSACGADAPADRMLIEGETRSPDGVAIRYDVRGSGGPTLVLIHGWTNSRRIWRAHPATLARTHRVVTLDLAGHGDSGADRADWTVDAFGSDVVAVVEALDLDRVVLVGFSMGGPVALEAAQRLEGRVVGIVLIDTMHDPERMPSDAQFEQQMERFRQNWGDTAFLRAFAYTADTPDSIVARLSIGGPSAPREHWFAIARGLRDWVRSDRHATLASVAVPVAAINTTRRPTNVEALRRYLPSFTLDTIQGVGHAGILHERVEEFDDRLRAIVERFSAGAAERHPPARSVAVTFDDVPMTGAAGACDVALIDDVTTRLLDAIERNRMPAAALVTTGRACGDHALLERTLRRWLEAGAVIGNHSHSHRDLNGLPLDEYIADIERAAALIDPIVASAAAADGRVRSRWFRPPLLHAGDTDAKQAGLDAWLERAGYRWAPVTIDNQEWVYADAYARALDSRDSALALRIVDAYLDHLDESFAYYEALAPRVLGYEPPQILLLHANLLNADHLDRVAATIRSRGYAFVSLPAAMADPAYARPDPYVGPRGLSWIQRWAIDEDVDVPPEPREAQWVADL